MGNLLKVIFAALLVSAAAVSCTMDESLATADNKVQVSITGQICDPAIDGKTKSSATTVVRLGWDGGETVHAYAGGVKVGELTASLYKSDKQYATLTGTLENVPQGTQVITLVHSNKTVDFNGGKVTVDLSSQDGTLSFVIYGTLQYNGSSIENELVKFNFATPTVLLTGTGIGTTGTATVNINGVNTVCAITPNADGDPAISGESAGTIAKTAGISASGDGRFTLNVAMAPDASDATTTGRTIEVTMDEQTYESAYTTKKMEEGKAYLSVYAFSKKAPRFFFTVSDKEEAPYDDIKKIIFAQGNLYCTRTGSEGNWTYSFAIEENQWDYRGICIDGYNYYDASFNKVAKNKITSTFPGVIYEENTSGLFQWISASCTGTGAEEARKNFGAFSSLSNEESYQGVSDEDILDFGKALGESSSWRTLTYNEWEYLIEVRKVKGNTGYGNTCVWATLENGVKGLIIFHDNYTGATTGLTSIPEGCAFLPAAGNRGKTNDGENRVQAMGGYGNYWSSTAYDSWCPQALYLYFYSGNGYTFYSTRDAGLSVRLISEIK